MDHELKQRLIGAIVVTALAAIFIPMLFDDPVETSGTTVKELTIPEMPAAAVSETPQKMPENKAEVLDRKDIELEAKEFSDESIANTSGEVATIDGLNGDIAEPAVEDGTASDLNTDSSSSESTPEHSEKSLAPSLKPSADPKVNPSDTEVATKPNDSTTINTLNTEQQPAIDTAYTEGSPDVIAEKPKAKSASPTESNDSAKKIVKKSTKKANNTLVRYSIQAGSFNKKENAQAMVDKLRKKGFPAALVASGDYFRVKVGPSLDKNNAKRMKEKLEKEKIKGLIVAE